ncbi:17491_t:CDS:2, partial [Racocetra persica]
LRAWHAMLNATEYTNITPFNHQESKRSLDNNKRGSNGKQRILLIIADSFPYQILRQKLQISPNTINTAKMYARINSYGCSAAPKPLMVKQIMSQERERQFEIFFSNKNNVNMSSYKTDNGMKRTVFFERLKNGPFIYKDDLGGLCSICSQYGYDIFFDLTNLVRKETYFISELENQKRYLKLQYCQHLKVNFDSTVQHDICINHCLLFAFGECNKAHTLECKEYSRIFGLFGKLHN